MFYQKAVEELVNKEAQDADDGITHVIDKEHIHHNCFVASSECPLVPKKTHEEDQLVEELSHKKTKLSESSDVRHLQHIKNSQHLH